MYYYIICGRGVVTSAKAGPQKSGSKMVVPATAQPHANYKKKKKKRSKWSAYVKSLLSKRNPYDI
jgi:hypothetical protein